MSAPEQPEPVETTDLYGACPRLDDAQIAALAGAGVHGPSPPGSAATGGEVLARSTVRAEHLPSPDATHRADWTLASLFRRDSVSLGAARARTT
jgi:hypothetical protein